MDIKYIIGIDEVGRGPIAGPVCVGAFIMPIDYELEFPDEKTKLRDSKKVTKKNREKWFKHFHNLKKEGKCDFAVSFVSAEMIDKFGIAKAIKKALEESLKKVVTKPEEVFAYLDGGLYAPDEYIHQETIIKGDDTCQIISCASIIAKVSRDKIMNKHSLEYPEYNFEKHVGYGTRAHYEAIKKHGLTPLHRKTFIH